MAVMALTLSFATGAFAQDADDGSHDYPFFGPQSYEDDFLYFGDETELKAVTHGIQLTVDETSVSHQSAIGEIRLDENLIEDRDIIDFLVLANDRVVDRFEPTWDDDTVKWRRVYAGHRFALESWNTGSNIKLQIVAVARYNDTDSEYVVAWSNTAGPYQFKDLPVVDDTGNGLLNSILAKLQQILDKLEELKQNLLNKLDQLNQSIREIYEIPPQTQANFDAAMANLQSKLPTEQAKQQVQQAQSIIENSSARIENTPQKVKFGEINWMGVVTTDALDFTPFMDQITIIRHILQIMLWCEFFFFVILILRPRLTV